MRTVRVLAATRTEGDDGRDSLEAEVVRKMRRECSVLWNRVLASVSKSEIFGVVIAGAFFCFQ